MFAARRRPVYEAGYESVVVVFKEAGALVRSVVEIDVVQQVRKYGLSHGELYY